MAFGSSFVQVMHLQGDETILEDLHCLDGINAGPHPITEIGAGTNPLAPALAGLQDPFGPPVQGRGLPAVVVKGKIDVVFVAEFLDRIQCLRQRLR